MFVCDDQLWSVRPGANSEYINVILVQGGNDVCGGRAGGRVVGAEASVAETLSMNNTVKGLLAVLVPNKRTTQYLVVCVRHRWKRKPRLATVKKQVWFLAAGKGLVSPQSKGLGCIWEGLTVKLGRARCTWETGY